MGAFEPKYRNLVQLFEESIDKYADRPLFGTKKDGQWRWMKYGEFGDTVNSVRGGLASLGVEKGDRVAIIANNRPEWAVAAYASYGLGASFVPMYESQLDKDWKFILKDCGAKVLFVANEGIRDRIQALRDELPDLKQIVVFDGEGGDHAMTFGELQEKGDANPADAIHPDSDDVAGFIYTSGTTGNPKGVLLSHENLASNVSAMQAIFPMEPDDRSLSFLPWAHSFGQVVELHGLFSMGASMGIAESVPKIVANLAEVRPTLLFSVPRIFNKIYDGLHKKMAEEGGFKKTMFDAAVSNASYRKSLAAKGASSGWADFKHSILDKLVFSKVRDRFGGRLKYAFSGGAALNKDVADFIDNLGIMVYEGYGLTETSPIATCNYPGHRKIGSVGKPIPGVEIDIDKKVTGDPENGEIIVYGHNVMKGYYGLDEENEKVFVEKDGKRGFRTGDMGRKDDEGFVYITGRIKEQYKLLNGKYVVPSPLEEQLKLSPFIANVMVFGDNREYNVALIVPEEDTLKKWAAERGLTASDTATLVKDSKVRELFREQLEQFSASFKQYEKCKDFTFCTEDFTTENGMLTPSLKLKRREVLKQYQGDLDAVYKTKEEKKAAAEARA